MIGFPKPQPKIVAKMDKRRLMQRFDRVAKEAVRKRDGESCRVCGRKSRDVHERVFKSRGGVASLENSMVACRLCHQYIHGHAIKVLKPSTNFDMGCNGYLKFEMSHAVAHHVFRGKSVPAHVEVVG